MSLSPACIVNKTNIAMKKERKQIVMKKEELSINKIIAEERASDCFLKSEKFKVKNSV